jgi:hypothetical protein
MERRYPSQEGRSLGAKNSEKLLKTDIKGCVFG